MSVDRHSAERDDWWWLGGVALGFAPVAAFVLRRVTVAKRRPARTTTPQVVWTEGEDDDRATGHNIIVFPRKAVSGPDVLEAIYDHIWEAIDGLWTFHDYHRGLARQLSERHFALAQTGLEEVAWHVACLLVQAKRAMEPAQDPDV